MLRLSLPPIDAHPANPPETRPSKVKAWIDDLMRRPSAVESARAIGDALAATNRVGMSDSRRLELAEIFWSAANTLWPILEQHFARVSHPLSRRRARLGEGRAHAGDRNVGRVQAPAGPRVRPAADADRAPVVARPRAPVPAMHGTHPRQQLPVVRAGTAQDMAGRPRRVRVRPRAFSAPAHRQRRHPRHDAGARVPANAAARAGQSLRLPARAARHRRPIPDDALPCREAYRRGARPPDGESGGDHPGRARLSAVFRQQGREPWKAARSTCSPTISRSSCRRSCERSTQAARCRPRSARTPLPARNSSGC